MIFCVLYSVTFTYSSFRNVLISVVVSWTARRIVDSIYFTFTEEWFHKIL